MRCRVDPAPHGKLSQAVGPRPRTGPLNEFSRSELGVDRVEEAIKSAAKGANCDDDYYGNEAHHDAVFNGCCALFAVEAVLEVEAEGLKRSDKRKHLKLLSESGWLVQHQLKNEVIKRITAFGMILEHPAQTLSLLRISCATAWKMLG